MTDPLLSPFISDTLDKLGFLGPIPRDGVADGPRLEPLPPALFGGGDAILNPGASILADLRDFPPALLMASTILDKSAVVMVSYASKPLVWTKSLMPVYIAQISGTVQWSRFFFFS